MEVEKRIIFSPLGPNFKILHESYSKTSHVFIVIHFNINRAVIAQSV
jgi:hypothetical protein